MQLRARPLYRGALEDDIVEQDIDPGGEEYNLRFVQRPYMTCKVLCAKVKATVDAMVGGHSGVEATVLLHNNRTGGGG